MIAWLSVVAAPEREKLGAGLNARLEWFHGVDTKDYSYVCEEVKPSPVGSFWAVPRT
jgi:hypothetical protein